MKRIKLFIIPALIASITLIASFELLSRKKGNYIGYKSCIECHGNDAIGNQVAVWKASPHSRAYRRLFSSEAKTIAGKLSIVSPDKSFTCLKCHNTGAGKVEKLIGEGVSCESCHGAAELWRDYEGHVSNSGDDKGFKRAVSLGMYQVIGIENIKTREKMCKRCHSIDRPCKPKIATDKKKLELPLEFIADFIYKHPVRR